MSPLDLPYICPPPRAGALPRVPTPNPSPNPSPSPSPKQAHYLASNYDGALRCCATCVKADASFAAASLLHAQILLRLEKYKAAHAVLEQALAHNFGIKESPVYNMVKAKALHTQGESEEARAALEKAMHLPISPLHLPYISPPGARHPREGDAAARRPLLRPPGRRGRRALRRARHGQA